MNHRIVSLIPSATEIVVALGREDQLVGRSHECDFPRSVKALPVCCESSVDLSLSSRELDLQVKTKLHNALSIFRVLPEVLDDLEPTVVITQTQCDVCAVSLDDVEQALCETIRSRPKLVACEPHCLSDIWNDIHIIGEAIDAASEAHRLIESCLARLESIHTTTASLPRPRVATLEWLDPLMTGGNWVPELIDIAGGDNLFGEAGKHSPWMEWDALLEADSEILILLPCGFGIDRCREEMNPLTSDPRWEQLTAVKNNEVYLTDGNQFFNRPGPRVVDSAEILAQILHPEHFPAAHSPEGWIRWED